MPIVVLGFNFDACCVNMEIFLHNNVLISSVECGLFYLFIFFFFRSSKKPIKVS